MRERTTKLIETFAALTFPSEFSLSPDGLAAAYTYPVGHAKQIFTMPVARAGLPSRITATLADCAEPHWSPDSQQLVFIRGKALWLARADGTNARELSDHPAGNTSPRWSPDGTRIAFLSRRRGWSHIWTIAPNGAALTQVTRGAFDATDPTWSPDGATLAFCSWRQEDLATRGVYLISADGGTESLISPRGCWNGAPCFSPDGCTLAYLSDRDGWFHVYLYDLSTRITRQLTCGEFEDGGSHFYDVDPRGGPLFSPDGRQIAFLRHRAGKFDVWLVQVAAGESFDSAAFDSAARRSGRRISAREGHYRLIGWLPDAQRLAVTYDNPTTPGDLWLLALDGQMQPLTNSAVADLQAHAILPGWITYPASDGLTIPAALFRPAAPAPAPAVVFVHGGPNFGYGEFYYPLLQILAQEGYVVLVPNYRGSTGYGTVFREANFREWGHADALDVVQGARWLQQQAFVAPNSLAVVGPSYGGYLTLCALTLAPELFCAGVDMYGDSDLVEAARREDREARMDLSRQMGAPEENPEGYRRGSPLYLAERIQAPLLILHGKEDMLVVPLMSEKMIEALKIENKYFESRFYEGEEHGFDKPENKKDAWERVVRFLNRHCKGEKETR
jgi:dipeptidyl aminopeptidase/acylaminoacyl peptidase